MVGAIVLYYYYNLLVRTLHAIRNGLFGAFDLLPAKLINTAKRKLVHKERVVPQKVTEKRGATFLLLGGGVGCYLPFAPAPMGSSNGTFRFRTGFVPSTTV